MREIKFRAWHKEKKLMLDVATIEFREDGTCEGARCNHPLIHGGNWYYYLDEDIKLIQYTGLKDKNGKEVYEGDIVECYVDGIKEISKVEFFEGCFCIRAKNNDPDYIPCLCTVDTNQTLEIIGNIYENPELIEGR